MLALYILDTCEEAWDAPSAEEAMETLRDRLHEELEGLYG